MSSYPPLPASPTLTNPDMILPDYEDSYSSPDRSQSPFSMWKNTQVANMSFDLTPQAFAGPITPTTPIIYGNGTMLSDIGEVTEVESTCPPNKGRYGSTRSDDSIQPASSMVHYGALKKKDSKLSRDRRASIDSTSTITTNEQAVIFADFDDTVSVDDSNFQGDDEESVADTYIDDASVQGHILPNSEVRARIGEERYSTVLSRRAEQILANAKRRLTTMEGNLNRARTTLYSPTLSPDSGSTPSPTMSRPTTAIHRNHDHTLQKSGHNHTRISSENNIPTLPLDVVKPGVYVPRSSSALGAAGGYRPPLHSPRSADYINEGAKGSFYAKESMLGPLSEDDASQDVDSPRPSLEGSRSVNFLNPNYMDKGVRRSASTAQMRDLKDHMQDLKGRLSSLRDQARADSLKRRSIQSLRTPSPFTHAQVDQWYADTAQYDDASSIHSDYQSHQSNDDVSSIDVGEGHLAAKYMASETDEERIPKGVLRESPVILSQKDIQGGSLSPGYTHPPMVNQVEDDLDMKTEDGYEDDNDGVEKEEQQEQVETDEDQEQGLIDDGASESDASSYYDTVQNQVSHEDREDAFDYEHFFLHSAMGSMSRSRLRSKGSRESFSSEDSVETTRGPVASTTTAPSSSRIGRRSRRGSTGSISSFDSFETATEGRSIRAENEYVEVYHEHGVIVPKRARTHTPDTARRPGFSTESSDSSSDKSRFRQSDIWRPKSSAAAFNHRPSVSSLDSNNTRRSLLLVEKPKVNGGMLTPRESPDRELKQISEVLLNESTSSSQSGDSRTTPIEMLQKDDRILVERLVASLGRCVLGLAESGRGSVEYRAYRRQIEMARRALESLDETA
ncbi:uncharacterized protein F4812DRAFT_451300 [Daldinia caldariorum]|uniref:uncharacterized protein n=1 Tax=Daldinia caldariorum TaxID=326644 RepID=UPI002007D649|nr:uncharacterized protein F4812DRAFT_451300 [Daldinia caldariorum]KAI1467517.1 hypothetical protein F4812DRAFT_451300 [Daldinia caldariorum]